MTTLGESLVLVAFGVFSGIFYKFFTLFGKNLADITESFSKHLVRQEEKQAATITNFQAQIDSVVARFEKQISAQAALHKEREQRDWDTLQSIVRQYEEVTQENTKATLQLVSLIEDRVQGNATPKTATV